MAVIYLVPNWFFGFDVAFELAFALITLVVSLYAFKVYKLSNQGSSKHFGLAFLSFSISYFIQSLLNFSIISRLQENAQLVINLNTLNMFNLIGIYSHMFFFIIGLVTLTYVCLSIRSKRTYVLILLISLLSVFSTDDKIYWFYLLSSILLSFIVIHYSINFSKNKQFRTFLVLIAFVFLLFGSIHFIFSVNHELFYVLGHFLELIAYILILINLYLVLRK